MKQKHSFYFKQFAVRHDRCAMKVGTDGVLLGAWADVANVKSILDIGTGSGVIALMLAQRSGKDCVIDAIEISERDFAQAAENVLQSPWPGKINVILTALQEFNPEKRYDLIVSNPPFFINSSAPPAELRKQARHTVALTFEELLTAAHSLLKPSGRLAIVLPVTEGLHFSKQASAFGLSCIRSLAFYSRKGKPQERWLMEFAHSSIASVTPEALVLYEDGNDWSDNYKTLMKAFYLAV